jgi:predicted phage terminase large subunit-like protein
MNDTTDGGNKDNQEEKTLDVVPIVPKRGRGRPKKIRKTVEELLLEASERLQRPVGGVSAPSIASKTPEKAPQSVEEVPADIQLAYETIQRSLRVIASRRANRDFLTYIRMMAPKVVDGFKMGRHIEVIAQKLQMVVDGKIKRLMVFLPPRSSKSVICSKLFPSWYIGRNPKHEIMTISHSDQLASDFGRSVRDIVDMPEFTTVFNGVHLRQDVRASGKWMTNKNGSYYAAGVRSQIAGRGAHIAILDDAMSEEDAISSAGRKYIKEWWPSGLRTRLMPNGSIIIINTRYHHDDLCGWLLRQEEKMDIPFSKRWDVIRIPAWLDRHSAKLLDLPEGSSYFPEWKSDEVLALDEQEIRATNGSRYWESLYMQNPMPDEGGIIKKNWVTWWEGHEPPRCDFIIQTYDTAFSTRTTADYSVIQTWGIFNNIDTNELNGVETVTSNLILLGNMKGRYEYPELRRIASQEYRKHRPDICIVEKKASGQSLIQDMRKSGLPVLEYTPDKDKVSRVYSASPMFESRRVWLPKDRSWSNDLFEELIGFPYAQHDDQVDACIMAVHYVKESWRLLHPEDKKWLDDEDRRKTKRVAYWRV